MKSNIQRLFQNNSRPQMIKLFIPSLLFLFSFRPGIRTGEGELPVIRKGVSLEGSFQRVSINGDISMILTNEPAGTIMMEGSEKAVNRIRYNVKNNELIIDAPKKDRIDELTIYLSVAALKTMLVNGNVYISSTEVINPGDLQLWLNGNINIKVKTTRKISIDAYDGYELYGGSR